MWKPGTTKPSNGRSTTRAQTPPSSRTEGLSLPSRDVASDSKVQSSSNSESVKKRLSGATLNMRFMKRKKETQQQQQRHSQHQQQEGRQGNKTTSPQHDHPKSSSPHQQQQRQQQRLTPSNAMDVDYDNVNDSLKEISTQIATPLDMYGMEGNMIGRRSFGGFNPAMEEAWNDNKAMIENGSSGRRQRQQHISDEELLKRYQEVVKNRDDDGKKRGVGNLKGKLNKGKQRRR